MPALAGDRDEVRRTLPPMRERKESSSEWRTLRDPSAHQSQQVATVGLDLAQGASEVVLYGELKCANSSWTVSDVRNSGDLTEEVRVDIGLRRLISRPVGSSSEPQYRDGFGPLTPGFRSVHFGDPAALAAAMTPPTSAVIVEPIQGEAGVILPPDAIFAASRSCANDRTSC